MSIMPVPELPTESELPSQPRFPQQAVGLHLSALDAYGGQPGALPGVGFWPRAAARLVDLIVHYAIAASSGFLFALLAAVAALLQHRPTPLAHLQPNPGAILVTALLGYIAFQAGCEWIHGSTPGKLLLGMTVVQEDGSPCRFRPAIIRSFAYFVDGLFFGLIGYLNMQKTAQQQRHGDEWAHTVVGRRSVVSPQNRRGGGRFALALFLATMADAALLMSGFLPWFMD